MTKKLWETKEWKEIRKKLLKESCEQCGGNIKLTLAHTKPFPKAVAVGRRVRRIILDEKIRKGTFPIFSVRNPEGYYIKTCPECNSRSIATRKVKFPKFRCRSCFHEFTSPNEIIDDQHPDLLREKREYYKKNLNEFQDEIDLAYNKEMDRLRQWYLSGEDTITYCNRCAFSSRKGMILCKSCKKHYHKTQFQQCFRCKSELCQKCGISRVLNADYCDDCSKKRCKHCNEEFRSELSICDNCVLAGHWDSE